MCFKDRGTYGEVDMDSVVWVVGMQKDNLVGCYNNGNGGVNDECDGGDYDDDGDDSVKIGVSGARFISGDGGDDDDKSNIN